MKALPSRTEPLVSVIMNCYNGERYLEEAIESLLMQTYSNWELIFWDNISLDQSAMRIAKFDDPRIKYFKADKHTSLGIARAEAWNHLTGDYICILDTDDLFLPEKIEKQLQIFEDDAEVGLVFSNTQFFSRRHSKPLYNSMPPIEQGVSYLINNYYISLESIMVSKKIADVNNIRFTGEYSHIADFDLVINIATKSKIKYLDEVLSKWRIHNTSETWKTQFQFDIEKLEWSNSYLSKKSWVEYHPEIIKLKHTSQINICSSNLIERDIDQFLKHDFKIIRQSILFGLPLLIFRKIRNYLRFSIRW